VLRGKLKRVVPRDNESVNETWISDRDRFSYEGIYSEDRLTTPLVRVDGRLREASWEEALEKAAAGLKQVAVSDGAKSVGAWVSPSATVEEAYLAGRLMRHLGSGNIDHRLRRRDFRGQDGEALLPGLGITIAGIEEQDGLLVVGSNLRREVPLLAHRVRKAALKGAAVSFINAAEYEFLFPVAEHIVEPAADFVTELNHVIAAAEGAEGAEAHRAIANSLKQASASIVLGQMALRHPAFADVLAAARRLSEVTGASLGLLTEGANSAGVGYAGALPYRGPAGTAVSSVGSDFGQMLASPLKALLLTAVEPEFDCADAVGAMNALADAEFIVALSPWLTYSASEHADVVLPMGTFAETSGTFVNAEGSWQSFAGVVPPVGESRPGWKILRVLGNLLDVPGFDYNSSESVRDELHAVEGVEPQVTQSELEPTPEVAVTAADLDVPIYAVDGLVRRAAALQQTQVAAPDWRKTA
jgi:NADH-quinone oxidoreductase subunit G